MTAPEWVYVPRFPTTAMREAGADALLPRSVDFADEVWRSMLNASPPSPSPASEDVPSFAKLADEALWKSVTVVHEGEAMAASEDVERARSLLPSELFASYAEWHGTTRIVAAALSAATEQARAEERERCAQRVERTGWPNCGDTAALIRTTPPEGRNQ